MTAAQVAVAQPSPSYALARERAAVIAAMADSFGRRPEMVRRVGRDRWSAEIGGCTVEAFIRTKPVFGRPPPPGPRRIEVLLDRKACPLRP